MTVVLHVHACRISDKSVLSLLPNRRAKEHWNRRGSMEHVVLVDDSSTLSSLSTGETCTLLTLRDALYKVINTPIVIKVTSEQV